MNDKQKQYAFGALLVILVLVAGVFGVKLPNPPIPEPLPFETEAATRGGLGRLRIGQDVQMLQSLDVDKDLNVDGAATIDGTITASGSLGLADDVTMGGALNVGTTATLPKIVQTKATTVTVTANSTIATNGDIVPLTSAGTVGTSSISLCEVAGRIVRLWNEANTTITITDTGKLKLTGNIALGQYDSLTLLGDGTNCIQLATSNN